MISSQALHLGPVMLPWTLLLVLLAMLIMMLFGKVLAARLQWTNDQKNTFQDSLWSSLWVGLIAARVVFVLIHWDAYSSSPWDILKVQDKGFELIGGVIIASLWFFWRNKLLSAKLRTLCISLFFTVMISGIWTLYATDETIHYPDLSFPALNSTTSESRPIAITQFKGQPTVINLWASWCPPCHREMPVLQQAHDQYPNIHFVMLNQGEEAHTVQQYLERNTFNFSHVLLDQSGEMPQHLQMFGLPSTLFFNAQGQLVAKHMGELTPAMLKHYLQQISP